MKNSSEVFQILRHALCLLHKGWCQKQHATDAEGNECSPFVEEATNWDLMGAIQRAAYDENRVDLTVRAYDVVRRFSNPRTLTVVNDDEDATFARVTCLLGRAMNATAVQDKPDPE